MSSYSPPNFSLPSVDDIGSCFSAFMIHLHSTFLGYIKFVGHFCSTFNAELYSGYQDAELILSILLSCFDVSNVRIAVACCLVVLPCFEGMIIHPPHEVCIQ